jgi:hypothetical protein
VELTGLDRSVVDDGSVGRDYCLAFGFWRLAYGVWRMAYGVYTLVYAFEFRIYDLGFGFMVCGLGVKGFVDSASVGRTKHVRGGSTKEQCLDQKQWSTETHADVIPAAAMAKRW